MKIFIDFDGTLVDSISAICHMFNEDYYKEKKF
jgi:phosphoglycolate phosphatase-like HAD superfamily hydrolase